MGRWSSLVGNLGVGVGAGVGPGVPGAGRAGSWTESLEFIKPDLHTSPICQARLLRWPTALDSLPLHLTAMPPIRPAYESPASMAPGATTSSSMPGSTSSVTARASKDDAALRAWRAAQRAHRLFDAVLQARLAAFGKTLGVTPSDLALLMKVKSVSGITLREASPGSSLRGTLKSMQRLVELGLLHVQPDPASAESQAPVAHQRLTLSDAGRSRVLEVDAIEARLVAQMCTTLTAEAQVQVLSSMQSMALRLDALSKT